MTTNFCQYLCEILADFKNSLILRLCEKFARIFHHTLTALLHYLVKYKFSKITTIRISTYAKTYLLKQFALIFNYQALLKAKYCLRVAAVSRTQKKTTEKLT